MTPIEFNRITFQTIVIVRMAHKPENSSRCENKRKRERDTHTHTLRQICINMFKFWLYLRCVAVVTLGWPDIPQRKRNRAEKHH